MIKKPLPLLEIINLHVNFKVYGGMLKVINGLSLTIFPGEKIGVVGEMGCGKTTTMKSIMRLLPTPPALIKEGEILFRGKDILKMERTELQKIRKKGISMIFENPTSVLNPVFTIGTQLKDIARNSLKPESNHSKDKLTIQNIVLQSLKEVMLPDPERVLKNYPIQLSGGMRQRICIAMTLIHNSDLIIADEPGTSLDVTIKDQIFRLLNNLVVKKNLSIILVSQSLGEVKNITDRVYVLYAGSNMEIANTSDLFLNPLHPYTQGLFNAIPRLTGEGIGEGIDGQIPNYFIPPKGCRFQPRCRYSMDICRIEKPPLYKVSPSHSVACFLFQKARINERAASYE